MAQHQLRRKRKLTDTRIKKLIITLISVISALLVVAIAAASIKIAYGSEDYTPRASENTGLSLNVLIFASGNDSDTADALVLCRLDADSRGIYVTSLPTDTYAEYNGRGDSLAGHMSYGGYLQTIGAAEALLDIDIDRYMSIALSDFEKIMDTLGGIVFDVPEKVIRQTEGGLPVSVEPGLQTLTGPQAGAVFAKNDWNGKSRYIMQEELMCAAIDQYLTADTLNKAASYFKTVANSVTTDISLMDLYDALPALSNILETGGKSQSKSAAGASSQRGGNTVFVLAEQSISELHSVYAAKQQ